MRPDKSKEVSRIRLKLCMLVGSKMEESSDSSNNSSSSSSSSSGSSSSSSSVE